MAWENLEADLLQELGLIQLDRSDQRGLGTGGFHYTTWKDPEWWVGFRRDYNHRCKPKVQPPANHRKSQAKYYKANAKAIIARRAEKRRNAKAQAASSPAVQVPSVPGSGEEARWAAAEGQGGAANRAGGD